MPPPQADLCQPPPQGSDLPAYRPPVNGLQQTPLPPRENIVWIFIPPDIAHREKEFELKNLNS